VTAALVRGARRQLLTTPCAGCGTRKGKSEERCAGKEKGLEVFAASWPPRWTRPGTPRPGDCWDSVDETPGVRLSRATPTLQSPHLSSLICPLDHLLSGVSSMYSPERLRARKKCRNRREPSLFLGGSHECLVEASRTEEAVRRGDPCRKGESRNLSAPVGCRDRSLDGAGWGGMQPERHKAGSCSR